MVGSLALTQPFVSQSPIFGWEVLEAEQDNLHLCLLGLGLRLQDLEQGLGPWTWAQSRMVQLQWEARVWEDGQGLRSGCQLPGVGSGFILCSRYLGRKGDM